MVVFELLFCAFLFFDQGVTSVRLYQLLPPPFDWKLYWRFCKVKRLRKWLPGLQICHETQHFYRSRETKHWEILGTLMRPKIFQLIHEKYWMSWQSFEFGASISVTSVFIVIRIYGIWSFTTILYHMLIYRNRKAVVFCKLHSIWSFLCIIWIKWLHGWWTWTRNHWCAKDTSFKKSLDCNL